jgi:hypothetical protein
MCRQWCRLSLELGGKQHARLPLALEKRPTPTIRCVLISRALVFFPSPQSLPLPVLQLQSGLPYVQFLLLLGRTMTAAAIINLRKEKTRRFKEPKSAQSCCRPLHCMPSSVLCIKRGEAAGSSGRYGPDETTGSDFGSWRRQAGPRRLL